MFDCSIHGWSHLFEPCPLCITVTISQIQKAHEHEAQGYFDSRFGVYYGNYPKCKICGKNLKIVWQEI